MRKYLISCLLVPHIWMVFTHSRKEEARVDGVGVEGQEQAIPPYILSNAVHLKLV